MKNLRLEDTSALKKQLIKNTKGAIEAVIMIMKAHEDASVILDPYKDPATALKRLRAHHEILQHADQFMSVDTNVASEILTGVTLMRLLELLPQRVRMEEKLLSVASTDTEEKYLQYEAFKKWTSDNLKILVQQDFRMEDEAEGQKTDIGENKGKKAKNEESLRVDESTPFDPAKHYPVREGAKVEHEEDSLEAHMKYDETNILRDGEYERMEELKTAKLVTANASYTITLRKIRPIKVDKGTFKKTNKSVKVDKNKLDYMSNHKRRQSSPKYLL